MSILIRGVEMPKNCELLVIIQQDGTVKYKNALSNSWSETDAVPVPPHGDLIARDELIENCMKEDGFLAELLFRKVSNAPTIIPAEEGET